MSPAPTSRDERICQTKNQSGLGPLSGESWQTVTLTARSRTGGVSFECLPYQLSMVG